MRHLRQCIRQGSALACVLVLLCSFAHLLQLGFPVVRSSSCVRCSAVLPSSVVPGLFAPHPWFYCSCSPLAFARFLVGFFCFFAHMSTRPGRSTNNSLAAMLDPTHLASQPSWKVSSSSVTSVSSFLRLQSPRFLFCFRSTISPVPFLRHYKNRYHDSWRPCKATCTQQTPGQERAFPRPQLPQVPVS